MMVSLGARPAAWLAVGLVLGWWATMVVGGSPEPGVLRFLAASLLGAVAWLARRRAWAWMPTGMALVPALAFLGSLVPGIPHAAGQVAMAAAIPVALALARAPPLVWAVPLPLVLVLVAFALQQAPPWLRPWDGAVLLAAAAAYLGVWGWRVPVVRRWAWFVLAASPLGLAVERFGYEATFLGVLALGLAAVVVLRRRAQPRTA